MPTFNCGLFLMRDLGGDRPTLEHVYDMGYRVCEVPVVVGPYLVMAAESGHAVMSLEMRDPEHPREVSTVVRFATLDRETGQLTLQPEQIDCTRDWPDGRKGSAVPHGAVFGRE